ncbi:MAG TPA: DUF6351 family protein [Telluria sp.]
MKPWIVPAACAAAAIVLSACSTLPDGPAHARVRISVLSSPPEYVSGGDARIEVSAPPQVQRKLTFWLNGKEIVLPWARDGDRIEGVVSGLVNGKNRLEVRLPKGHGQRILDSIILTNYPITGPMFSGPQQQPFICRSQESGLGQPLPDNWDGIGHPVFDASGQHLIGYSKYCSITRRFGYFYYTGRSFAPFDPATDFQSPPPDLQTTTVKGATVPFVVRVEVGTINRFLYTVAMLAPFPEQASAPDRLNNSAWNRKLVYWLRGGIGIGHQQGTAMWFNGGLSGIETRLMPHILGKGYALVSSSGNETGVHYNMRLAQETALMTKEHFIETYGKPRFTIGAGGSGGAVQQYYFAQNRPALIDGGIPVQSYPDMITQTNPVLDCPLLGQYFRDEVALNPASPWARWSRHALIEGMNASDTVPNRVFGGRGSTECINGWFTATPTVLNPLYKDPRYDEAARFYRYPDDVFANVKWTHWNDLANIYGTDSRGYAPISIDNVGVQYGLRALFGGQIDKAEFLRINACIGGWKEQPDFVAWVPAPDPFDSRNMKRSASCREPAGTPAPRRKGDLAAIYRAYSSGHVFTGRRLPIPMIDLRPYLEPALDMHNSRQSFSVRARLLDANPKAAMNQVIWFTGSEADLVARVPEALSVIDRYLGSRGAPAEFTDKCVDAGGALIASGPSAWDGIVDRKPPGACTRAYPVFSSPRMVAGDSIKGDIFKCALKPVWHALRDGSYPASVLFTPAERQWLHRIFPDGVCDYSRPGQGRPRRR